MSISMFAFSAWFYVSTLLKIPDTKSYDIKLFKWLRDKLAILALVIFGHLAIVVVALFLLPQNYTTVNEYYQPIALAVFDKLFFALLISAGLMFFFYILHDTLKTDWAGTLAAFSVCVLSLPVWYNHYRDTQKSAFIADNQYCYWFHAAAASIPKDAISNFRDAYRFDPTCAAQRQKGVVHFGLRVLNR